MKETQSQTCSESDLIYNPILEIQTFFSFSSLFNNDDLMFSLPTECSAKPYSLSDHNRPLLCSQIMTEFQHVLVTGEMQRRRLHASFIDILNLSSMEIFVTQK